MYAVVQPLRPQDGQGKQGRVAMGRGSQQGKGDVTQFNRDNAAPQPSIALAATCAAELPKTVAACFPWLAATGAPALNPLPGSDTQRRERPGPAGDLVPAGGTQPRAARRRALACASSPTDLRPSDPAPSGAPAATRPSPLATAGVSRETPAATNPTRPARLAGRKEEM